MGFLDLLFGSGAVGIIIVTIGFYYFEFYKTPKLTYQIFRPYEKQDEKIVLINIGNEGHANATNVRLTIKCNGPIQELSEEIFEEVEIERQDQNIVIYKFPRLTHQITIPIYITLSSLANKAIDNIEITSDQVSGQEYNIPTTFSLAQIIWISMGSFMIGVGIALMLFSQFVLN